jgi:hypothetical protein
MNWTPEAVKAQMDYRIEDARRHATVTEFRKTHTRHPSWWRRIRRSQH